MTNRLFKLTLTKWKIIFIPILILSILGIFNLKIENAFLSILNVFLEVVLLATFLVSIHKLSVKVLPLSILSLVYIIISFYYAVILHNNHLMDFLVVYKSFLYIVIVSFLVNKSFVNTKNIELLFKFLMISFLIAYLIDFIFFGDKRPQLLGENNYEMMFFAIIIYLYTIKVRKLKPIEILICLIIFTLSASRSGLVIFFFLMFIIYFDKFNLKNVVFGLLSLIPVLLIALFIFKSRMSGNDLESIDRVRMLFLFQKEISDWNFLNFLFGTVPIQEMSPNICSAGEFSYTLKNHSYKNDGSCYSVVLHSFILRAIYDHGLLGLLFITYTYYRYLRLSVYTHKESIVFSGIVILNSISVSGYNSIFSILGFAIVLSYKNHE